MLYIFTLGPRRLPRWCIIDDADMRVIKCGLNGVARSEASKAFFREVVRRAHDAKTAAHLLCKAWILRRHQDGTTILMALVALA